MSITSADPARRLDIGKVLSDGLGVLTQNFGPLFLLALLLQGVPTAVSAWGRVIGTTHPLGGLFIGIAGLAQLVTLPILHGALIFGAMRGLEGQPAPLDECLRAGTKRWLPMLGLMVGAGILIIVGVILFIVPGVFLALRWSVAAPALLLEGRGVAESMGRSADLTRDRRWSIFLLFLIFVGLQFVFGAILGAVGGAGMGFGLGLGLRSVAPVSAVIILLTPITSICSTLVVIPVVTALFRELRGDKEGANPEALSQVFA